MPLTRSKGLTPATEISTTAATGAAVCASPLPVLVRYPPIAQREAQLRTGEEHVLAEIFFGSAVPATRHIPSLQIDMPQLGGTPLAEVWLSYLPVRRGRSRGIGYSCNDQILFGVLQREVAPSEARFEESVCWAYLDILGLIEGLGYPHLLRVWNYFPQINSEAHGLENYRRFSRGRYQAFERRYGECTRRLPAASALGSRAGGLNIYFIASKEEGAHRENPRQVSAYHYPPQYGPRSPSFARATLKRWGTEEFLFISGTASVVGHETRHQDALEAQLREALRNVEVLLQTTGRDERTRIGGLSDLDSLKVYLRHPRDYAAVKAAIETLVGADVPALYLQGDICRDDLLVEVEGIAR